MADATRTLPSGARRSASGAAYLPEDPHDRALIANVHPPDWINPDPAPRYNLVVIGAGTAGLVTAAGAAGLGARVALVERGLMGGDCLNVGCVPSKALIRAARAFADVRDAAAHGVRVPPVATVDFPAVMERMRRLRASISPTDSAARFRRLGIDVFLGAARFTGRDSLEVDGRRLRFARAAIATGGRPAVPDIPGLEQAGYLTNETVFALTELPRRLAVIGSGPIGCELTQAFARFGSLVTLLERGPRIMPREEPEAAELVTRAFGRDGVSVRTRTRVVRVEPEAGPEGRHRLLLEREGRGEDLPVDAILVGVGRVPNVEDLGLEAAGVIHDRTGVVVDDALRTSNPRIYAAGDVGSRFKFTHMADALARIVVRNALFPGTDKASALVVPWCTYTDPEVAHVGLYEHEARARGIAVRTFVQELAEVDRAILDGEAEGFVKVHVREGTDEIVGATLVARHAGETISELTLAMVGGLGLKTLSATIHPYPTQAEALKKLGDAYNRSRLTPLARRLLGWWMAFRR